LSRFVEELPEASYRTYADALASALRDPSIDMRRIQSSDLERKLYEFATRLEQRGYTDKASIVREAVSQRQTAAKE
jgi:hypothetical protein